MTPSNPPKQRKQGREGSSPLGRLTEAIKLFQDQKDRLELTTVRVFLAIAENPGSTAQKIARLTDLAVNSVSRNTTILGDIRPADGRVTLGLVRQDPDPEELRRNIYTLTPAGMRLAARLREAIEGNS